MNKFYAAIFASVVLTLTACGSEDSEPYYSDTGTYEDYSDYEDDSDIGVEALDLTWDSMSESDHNDVCDGYVLIPETIIDTIREGNEDYLTREDVRDFLDENC